MTALAAIMADFKTQPYIHQLRELEASMEAPARALFWQMRTGKTKVIIDTACHLFKTRKIDTVLILAPNGVHENWVTRELPIHHWDTVEYETLAWRTLIAGSNGIGRVAAADRDDWKEARELWWEKCRIMAENTQRLAWFSFNSESMTRPDVRKIIKRLVTTRNVLAVFDESHDFRRPGSKRTKMARAFAKRCPYVRLLTGTPVTNSPLHAFSQFELIKPGALGFTKFKDFKEHFAVYEIERNKRGQSYPVLKEYKNLDELQTLMAPWSSVVLRDDCHDLPELVRSPRHVELSNEQIKLYRELHKQFEVMVGDTEVSIGENSPKLSKLQQIVSGFLIDEFKDVHTIPGGNPRLEALSEEVHLSPGKVIVWCRFQEDMDRVAERLTADGHEIVQYHGRVSAAEKARVRALFAPGAENDVKALVGFPTAGLDLSAAGHIMWYSHTFDAIMREQADERATAMGGKNVMVTDFVAKGVDEYILENVLEKISIADALAGTGMRDALRRTAI